MNNLTLSTKELPDSEVEISVVAPWEDFAPYRAKGLKALQKEIEMPGFRKGGVPESMIVSKLGEVAILGEAAELFIQDAYGPIMEKQKISPIGRPAVSITKIAEKNPLEFTLTTAVLPKATLADYAKIAKKVNAELAKEATDGEVTEKEIDETFERVTKEYEDHMKAHADHEGHDHSVPTRDDVKIHLAEEKKNRALEKKRIAVIEGIITDSEIPVPKILVESELEKMMEQFEADIARMGIKPQEYFTHIKKTPEELKKDWTADAEKRVKTDIILSEIAAKEKLTADKDRVDFQVSQMLEMYKGADPLRARVYVQHMLTNQKVFEFLDAQ